jgi:ligand-binding sensor domain-containing protein/two-component sensor histidine kinase
MTNSIRDLLLLLVILLLPSTALLAQEIFHTNYSKKTGLPSNTVYFAMQDSNGFMWFGTDAGLCRYDGHEFKTYTPQQGLSDNEVFQLMEDSQKRIWCLTFNGKICFYKNGIFYNAKSDTTLKNLEANEIYCGIFEDKQKRIWLGATTKGIYVTKPNGHVDHVSLPSGNTALFHIWESDDEILGLSVFGIYHFNKDNPHIFHFEKIEGLHLNSDASRKPYVDTLSRTLYYPGVNKGILLIDYQKNTFKKVLDETPIIGLKFIDNNTKWVYHPTGAFLWEGENKMPIESELKGSVIAHITKDLEGGFWIASLNNGVFYIPSLNIKHLKNGNGMSTLDIRRVVQKQNGDILAFEEKGEYSIISKKDYSITHHPSILPQGNVRLDEIEITDDTIWIVGKAAGLIKMYDHKIESYFHQGTIKSIHVGKSKISLAAGYKGLVQLPRTQFHARNKKELDRLEPQPIVYEIRCFSLHVLPDETVLMGTSSGLCAFRNGALENLSSRHPYLQKRITNIKQGTDGTIWIIVDATAVVALNAKLEFLDVIDASTGINKETCNRLYIDYNNEAWIVTNHSVYHADLIDQKVKLRTIFTLETETINDIVADEKNVWLATSGGILTLPRTFKYQREIHPHFTEIYINTKRIDPSRDRLIVSHNQNNFRIRFTSISFNTKNILYRYKTTLDQTNWTVTESNDLEFSSLSPGNYCFQIQVKGSNENWSKHAAAFNLTIEKPLWQRWWFIVFTIVIIMGLLIITIRSIYRANYKKVLLNDRLIESELKALVAQMNPHFIFNTLNTIQKFFITYDTKTANKLLSRFSSLMRMLLDNTSKSFISIEDEVAFLRNYLEIEKMRFNQNFEYEIIVDQTIDPSAVQIPSMTIQPFVENAIIHGIMPKKDMGKINLTFQSRGEHTHIIIEDNGVGREHEHKKRTHIPKGINLIRERLDILSIKNKKSYRIEIVDLQNPTGTRVEIYL